MIRSALVATAVLLLAAAAARAQDGPAPSDPGAAPPAPAAPAPPAEPAAAAPWRPRALDMSAMIDAFRAGKAQPDDVPLADRDVLLILPAAEPGGAPSSLTLRTGPDGRFDVPRERLRKGGLLSFLVQDPAASERWPLYATDLVPVGDPMPDELPFLRVHDGPSPLSIAMLSHIVTVPDLADGVPSLRVNLIAQVRSASDRLWIGERGKLERGTVRIPVPAGLELVGATAGRLDVEAEVVGSGDAREAVLRQPVLPGLTGVDLTVRLVLTGAYVPDRTYDFSFRPTVPVDGYSISLEDAVLRLDPAGDVEFADGGVQEISGKHVRTWQAGHVHPGVVVGARFGPPRVDRRVWLTLGAIGCAVAGSALLARALARRAESAAPAPPKPKPEPKPKEAAAAPADARAARQHELDRRLAKGEITKFEHAARSKALAGGVRPPAPSAPRDAEPSGARLVDEISSRVDTADAETLRRDVRSLLAVLRGRG